MLLRDQLGLRHLNLKEQLRINTAQPTQGAEILQSAQKTWTWAPEDTGPTRADAAWQSGG